jgi:hypothetical protein
MTEEAKARQRENAIAQLQKATAVRVRRAEIRAQLGEGSIMLDDLLLLDAHEADRVVLAKVPVLDLLTWQRRVGRSTAQKVCAVLGWTGDGVTLATLSPARRQQLVDVNANLTPAAARGGKAAA